MVFTIILLPLHLRCGEEPYVARNEEVKSIMKMKKLFVCACALALVAACVQSPVEKAEALIKTEKSKTLSKTTKYEAIETTVDSAFAPQDDPTFFKEMEEATKMNERYNAMQEDLNELKDSIDVLSKQPGSKSLIEELDSKCKNLEWEIGLVKAKGHDKYYELMAMVDGEPRFIGYKAMHTYKIQNEAGTSLPTKEFYLLDEKMEQIVYSCSSLYYEEAQEGIQSLQIANAIKKDREGEE